MWMAVSHIVLLLFGGGAVIGVMSNQDSRELRDESGYHDFKYWLYTGGTRLD